MSDYGAGMCSDGRPCGAPAEPGDEQYCMGCPNAPDTSSPHYDRALTKAADAGLCAAPDECSPLDSDPVSRPSHYQSDDGIECIDAIRAALGLEGFVAHCRGTAIKYAWRSGKKQKHAEDLRKAAWYLTRAAEELESQ